MWLCLFVVPWGCVDVDDTIADGQVPVMSSDSGVRTDTAACSTSNPQHDDCSEGDMSSAIAPVSDSTVTLSMTVPTIVIEESANRHHHDTSDSEVFTSESKINPSNASVEQYLFGSEHFSDAEHTASFPKEQKCSNGSVTELHSNTLASFSSLSHSTELLGDITTTCRSKRRLLYSGSSEPETRQGLSESYNNDEIDTRSPNKSKFNTVLPTPMELPEESTELPGTQKTQNSCDDNSPSRSAVISNNNNNNNRMSSFLKSLSPVRLMSLRPKKRVTFTT